MNGHKIEPQSVTKPIQLLAAWLVGLVVVDGMFLASTTQMGDSWERSLLVVAAVVNVPLFLTAIFVLQTKFRAELQEDTFYSAYLSKKTSTYVRVDEPSEVPAKLDAIEKSVELLITERRALDEGIIRWGSWRVGLNEWHPRFSEIRAAMRERGIPLAEIFGNKGSSNSAPPSHWVVSINKALPARLKAELLALAVEFQLEGFTLWTPVREAEETEDVYFGSYGTSSGFVRIAPELAPLLEAGMEDADLNHYAMKHRFMPGLVGEAAQVL